MAKATKVRERDGIGWSGNLYIKEIPTNIFLLHTGLKPEGNCYYYLLQIAESELENLGRTHKEPVKATKQSTHLNFKDISRMFLLFKLFFFVSSYLTVFLRIKLCFFLSFFLSSFLFLLSRSDYICFFFLTYRLGPLQASSVAITTTDVAEILSLEITVAVCT